MTLILSEPRLHRESVFHDEWARLQALSEIRVYESFESVGAFENRFILSEMGDLRGKRILDVGSGLGEASIYFALKGAIVTACDISPKMLELTQTLAKFHQVSVQCILANAERLNIPDQHYDYVYAANLFHHVQDQEELLRRLYRSLRPGGTFFCWDPLAYNPVINIYRRLASQVRTSDEAPLTTAFPLLVKNIFGNVSHRKFWLCSLAIFLKYYLLDRLDLNKERYWKKVIAETDQSVPWLAPLQRIDSFLTRIPLLRWLSWNMVVWARNPELSN